MGKRARKRGVTARPAAAAAPAPAAARPRPRRAERPKAPWHPVPLAEIATFAGIVLLIVGLLDYRERRWLVVAGLGLASLGGLDTAAREHFARFRPHTSVLSGLPAVALAVVLYFAKLPWPVVMVVPIVVFALAFRWLWGFYHRSR